MATATRRRVDDMRRSGNDCSSNRATWFDPVRPRDNQEPQPEPVTPPAPDPVSWLSLFNLGEAEHICDAIRITILNRVHAGDPTGWQANDLRRFVLDPLDSYIAEHFDSNLRGIQIQIEMARALFDVAERLSELFADEYPFFVEDATAWQERLWRPWVEFVAFGSAHRIYWDIPAKRKQAREAASRKRTWPDVEDVVSFMGPRGLTYLSEDQAKELAAMCPDDIKEPPSVRTIRRRVKEARGRGLLPPK